MSTELTDQRLSDMPVTAARIARVSPVTAPVTATHALGARKLSTPRRNYRLPAGELS